MMNYTAVAAYDSIDSYFCVCIQSWYRRHPYAAPWALSLWYAYYNFCRVHRTLRVTPAMEAGITDHIWTLPELVAA